MMYRRAPVYVSVRETILSPDINYRRRMTLHVLRPPRTLGRELEIAVSIMYEGLINAITRLVAIFATIPLSRFINRNEHFFRAIIARAIMYVTCPREAQVRAEETHYHKLLCTLADFINVPMYARMYETHDDYREPHHLSSHV